MNAEGVGPAITAEFLQATATGVLLLVAAWWLWLGQNALWRRFLWSAGARATAGALRATVTPRGAGLRLVAEDVHVEYGGGLWGAWTSVAIGGARESRDGVLGADATLEVIAALRERSKPPPPG